MNDIVWVKVNKAIWQGKFIQIPFSDIKEESEYLKKNWIYTKKNLIRIISLDYSKIES